MKIVIFVVLKSDGENLDHDKIRLSLIIFRMIMIVAARHDLP